MGYVDEEAKRIKRNEYERRKYAENIEARRKYLSDWRIKNIDTVRANARKNARKRYANNPAKYIKIKQQFYNENKEQILKIQRSKQRCYNLKSSYGITCKQYEEMLLNQKNSCKICESEITFKTATVDHDHETGIVRDLLCRKCNAALGSFKENSHILRRAAEYINHWRDQIKEKK